MQISYDYNQLSQTEQNQIEAEIKTDLVEHLYRSSPTGIVASFVTGASLFSCFYFLSHNINNTIISSWYAGFNFIILLACLLYKCYRKLPSKLEVQQWEFLLSTVLSLYAVFYGSCIYFIAQEPNPTNQFLAIGILVMIAAALGTSTVGFFKLGIVCVSFILIPVAAWFFLQPATYYKASTVMVVVYYAFLLGMNRRSTEWLNHSLKLKLENTLFTHQANFDLLTDLPNQRLLTKYIEQAVKNSNGRKESFALVCFAINRLEIFNNSLGYYAGDLIINSVAKRLKSQLSAENNEDTIQRILTRPRPDAFTILFSPINIANTEKEVQSLFTVLEKPFHLGNQESRLTASAGVTIFPKDSPDPEKLLSNTYAAMLEAKASGGNQVAYYQTNMTSKAPLLLELERDLSEALDKQEFEVYYQPIVDLQLGLINEAEALIRWNHPRRGIVPPNDFIPMAEETGLIIPMGEWVLEQASAQAKQWHKQGYKSMKVAINLSPKQLRQGNLIAAIDRVLKKTGVDPTKLELELTETAILDESLSPLVKEISRRGIALAIDDFGTGYSGLSYLKYFQIDKIKIDKSFIDDVVTNNDSATIVSATLAMAKELGIKTLAEGVETIEQLRFLKERGCQFIQGYYFSKPLKIQNFTELLRHGVTEKL